LLASLFSLALLTETARAQLPSDERSFDVQLFHAPVGPHGFITLDTAKVPAHQQFALSLTSNYQRSAFSIVVESDRPELAGRFDVVRHQIASELTLAVGLFDRFEIGIGVPVTLYLSGNDYNAMGQPDQSLSAAGIGDIRIEAKANLATVSLSPGKELNFALAPGLTLPTGDGTKFLGERTVTGRLRGIAELDLERFRAAMMAGFSPRRPHGAPGAPPGAPRAACPQRVRRSPRHAVHRRYPALRRDGRRGGQAARPTQAPQVALRPSRGCGTAPVGA